MIGAIIGAAASIGSSIYGAVKGAQQARKQQRAIDNERKANEAWYNRRYNEDATQRADAQRILNKTRDIVKERNRAARGTQAVVGGTEESVRATEEQGANALSDAAGQIAANAETRKDAIEEQYHNNNSSLRLEAANLSAQKQANTAEAVKGAISAAGTIASAVDSSKGGGKTAKSKTIEATKDLGNEGVFNDKSQKWLADERNGIAHQYTAEDIAAQKADEEARRAQQIGNNGRISRGY